jgi:hypothetical protein
VSIENIANNDVLVFGFSVSLTLYLTVAGVFGGFLPYVVDMIHRQNLETSKRPDLCKLYYFVKLGLIPLCSLFVTIFAATSGNVTTWLSALYLGATFPIFAQKAVSMKQSLIDIKPGA